MNWKGLGINFSYLVLGIIIPSLSIIIYKKIAEPISSYLVNENIKIKEEDYNNLYNENDNLIKDIEKLQKVKKMKGE